MSNSFPEIIFKELTSKLRAAGLPERQVQSFAEQCLGYRDSNPAYFELFKNHQMPSDDCFKTLAEAQKIFASKSDGEKDSKELDFIDRYLKTPYSDVLCAKSAMSDKFGCGESDIDAVYAQDPEWLLISADSVNAFAAFLGTKFSDSELIWSIYKEAALLGLEETQRRINKVLALLGVEIGEKVIRNDLQGDAWLFYRWFTDPVGCIGYMLEHGMTPEKVLKVLKQEPQLLYVYKETREWEHKYLPESVNSMMQIMDSTIRKYSN